MTGRIIVLILVFAGAGLIQLSNLEIDPRLLYNRTDSAPIGWYQIVPQSEYEVGDLVAAWLPDGIDAIAYGRGYLPKESPIVKTVFAVSGDTYCIARSALVLGDGRQFNVSSTDSQGRDLPVLADGCRRLNVGEYLLLSDRVSSSFDGRYFGVVSSAKVIGIAVFLGEIDSMVGWNRLEKGGARGSGAEGKIKGGCTNRSLSPCLHIDFACTKFMPLAPARFWIASIYRG